MSELGRGWGVHIKNEWEGPIQIKWTMKKNILDLEINVSINAEMPQDLRIPKTPANTPLKESVLSESASDCSDRIIKF